jgi:hypothetical protein
MKIYNPGRTPQIIDTDGHILGGDEWGDAVPNPVLQAALDDGRLLTPPAAPSTSAPPAPSQPAAPPAGADASSEGV